MEFVDSIRDNGIYTKQGDKVGEIYDESIRQDVLDGLNCRIMDDEEEAIIDALEENKIDDLKELMKLFEDSKALEKLIELFIEDFLPELDQVQTDVLMGDDCFDYLSSLRRRIDEKIIDLYRETRKGYLEEAMKDIKAGMESHRFKAKWRDHKSYDADDWLMLRNFVRKDLNKK
jgi:hypothetical protein